MKHLVVLNFQVRRLSLDVRISGGKYSHQFDLADDNNHCVGTRSPAGDLGHLPGSRRANAQMSAFNHHAGLSLGPFQSQEV